MSLQNRTNKNKKLKNNQYILYLLIPIIILSCLSILSTNSELFVLQGLDHFYFEMFSVTFGIVVAIYSLSRGYALKDRFSLFIGLGFFVSSIIDLLHGGFSLIHLGDTSFEEYFIPQTWVAGRILMGIVMAIAIIKFSKAEKNTKKPKSISKEIIYYTIFLSGLASVVTMISLIQPLPFLTIDSIIKRPYEILAASLFVFSAIFYFKQKLHHLDDPFYKGVILVLVIDIFGSIIISTSSIVFDTAFNVAHILKNITFFIFIATLSWSSIYHHKIKEKFNQDLNESKKALNEASIIAITDANGIITEVNDKFVEISKYSREELIGSDHNLLKSGYHSREFYRKMWGTITFGKIWRGEIKNKAKDGTFYWVQTNIIPNINEQGKIVGYTTVRTDITEQKEQQERLAGIDVKKDEFMSMISHELKTPLSPIMSWSGMLYDGVLGEMTEKQKHGIMKIQENSKDLLSLINDILDVHKLELGKMNFTMTYFNIKKLLSNIIEDYKLSSSNHCTYLLESDDIIMNSDTSRITQIIKNFLNNAMDFLPENDPKITLSARNENNMVVISVKDNGKGIPKESQKNLFKKFYQVDTSATREHGGTGLGLSICNGIAIGLRGKIGVHSEINQGSEFFIKIPRNATIELTN
ncbi:ATP-binding protein [Nitrosopumilus adriaticus]|uniref:ATP-binding protein n=1 Tax=Nitrosopumilus adriaticus TaxID=1580092 RepID=UPI00352E121D